MRNAYRCGPALLGGALLLFTMAPQLSADDDGGGSLLGNLGTPTVLSTVPANGDGNPYGVAFVPQDCPADGMLKPGDILVSNFNNGQNLQGTGTTIVRFHNGKQSLFFQGQPPLGLTTGLAVLHSGLVLVGNLPTTDGTAGTAGPGSLIALDRNGNVVWTLADPNVINGPWDLAVNDLGGAVQVFVTNVLTGNVVRIDLLVAFNKVVELDARVISSGYAHRADPVALVVGPTGLAYDVFRDVLYVASTEDNAVYAIANASHIRQDGGLGFRIYQDNTHLHGPLGMILAPNGHLIVSNSDVINSDPMQPSELVEFTIFGQFVSQLSVDPAQGGSFGLNAQVQPNGSLVFAAVDDNTASLLVWNLKHHGGD